MAKKKDEIQVAGNSNNKGYLMLNNFDLNEAMSSEMNGLSAVFDRIKMPAGGTTVFQIPGEDAEETNMVKEFSAVILYHHPIRAYFKEKYSGAIVSPDCGSLDAINGFGEPGGVCVHCKLNVYGSGENNAKACKERRRLYLLREGEMFPVLFSLPTGSLKEFSRYVMRCLSKGNKTNQVVTKFSLIKATNKGGIAYAKAVFGMERKLTEDEILLVEKLTNQLKEVSSKVGFEEGGGNEKDVDVVEAEPLVDDLNKSA